MSFPHNPSIGDQHNSCGEDFYWCGTHWVKPGEVKGNVTQFDLRNPNSNDTHLAYGSNWVNLATGDSFEFISPGLWRPLAPEPSIQISNSEPQAQSSGLPLTDGDLWVNPVKLSINIYSEKEAGWFDVLASITAGTPTKGVK